MLRLLVSLFCLYSRHLTGVLWETVRSRSSGDAGGFGLVMQDNQVKRWCPRRTVSAPPLGSFLHRAWLICSSPGLMPYCRRGKETIKKRHLCGVWNWGEALARRSHAGAAVHEKGQTTLHTELGRRPLWVAEDTWSPSAQNVLYTIDLRNSPDNLHCMTHPVWNWVMHPDILFSLL